MLSNRVRIKSLKFNRSTSSGVTARARDVTRLDTLEFTRCRNASSRPTPVEARARRAVCISIVAMAYVTESRKFGVLKKKKKAVKRSFLILFWIT